MFLQIRPTQSVLPTCWLPDCTRNFIREVRIQSERRGGENNDSEAVTGGCSCVSSIALIGSYTPGGHSFRWEKRVDDSGAAVETRYEGLIPMIRIVVRPEDLVAVKDLVRPHHLELVKSIDFGTRIAPPGN